MRFSGEPIYVRVGGQTSTYLAVPEQFVWRERLWRVTEVQRYWREVSAWWQQTDAEMGEHEIWRVEASNGQGARRGVYDLVHVAGGSDWWLRGVLD